MLKARVRVEDDLKAGCSAQSESAHPRGALAPAPAPEPRNTRRLGGLPACAGAGAARAGRRTEQDPRRRAGRRRQTGPGSGRTVARNATPRHSRGAAGGCQCLGSSPPPAARSAATLGQIPGYMVVVARRLRITPGSLRVYRPLNSAPGSLELSGNERKCSQWHSTRT
jgi:hypothetical protein